jgi:hypothetical protein
MQETKREHLFDIKDIMSDVEKVIQRGLNKLLVNYIERHELLEKTHQQLIQLPSIAEELNKRTSKEHLNECSSYNDTHIKDSTQNIVRDQFIKFENKLNEIEDRYNKIMPILDNFKDMVTKLSTGLQVITETINNNKNNNTEFQQSIPTEQISTDIIRKSTIVTSSENENIEIHIKESKSVEEEQEQEEQVEEEEQEQEEQEQEEQEQEEQVEEEQEEEEQEEEEQEEEEQEEEEQEEEEQVEEEEEQVEEEEEQEEEEQVEEEEEQVEEEEEQVEEEEEQVEEEEEQEEEASIETESKEKQEESDNEEDDIFEIEIDDKTYCTNDDENGFIWELTVDGEQGLKVGYLKDGEPFFYADEN